MPSVMIVGESNPYGADPAFAMYPSPQSSAGYRLAVLVLGMRRSDYLRTFDRANLCAGKWSIKEARVNADAIRSRKLILCGSKVCSAFGIDFNPFTKCGDIVTLPHPSGLCRLWNEPDAFENARAVVREAFPDLAAVIGVDDSEDGGYTCTGNENRRQGSRKEIPVGDEDETSTF